MFSGYLILNTSVKILRITDRRHRNPLVSEDKTCNFDIMFPCAVTISHKFQLFKDHELACASPLST